MNEVTITNNNKKIRAEQERQQNYKELKQKTINNIFKNNENFLSDDSSKVCWKK